MGLINGSHFIFSRLYGVIGDGSNSEMLLLVHVCVLSGLVCFIWKVLKVQASLNNYTCC